MKKISAIFLCFMFLLSVCFGCSGQNSKDEIFIGEGKMTFLRAAISANGFLANEVFGANHLPVDASKTITRDNRIFAPVVSDRIKSHEDLEALLNATYVEEVAQELLNEPKKYFEIDGKLYFDMQYDGQGESNYLWDSFETEFKKLNDDGTYLFKVKLKKSNGWNSSIKISAADVDGRFKLCDFYC